MIKKNLMQPGICCGTIYCLLNFAILISLINNSTWSQIKLLPSLVQQAPRVAEWFAERTGGIAQSGITESSLNIPTTAHILGGAVIGDGPEHGVVDASNRVYGYENLMVCDGAAIPANPGVNPSLTITALAEHAMAQVPQKGDASPDELPQLPEAARPAKVPVG